MVAVPKARRFPAWAASLVFTCVCLAAHASTTKGKRSSYENWVLAALCINFIFSFFGVVAHFFVPEKFNGRIPEGGLSGIMVVFWCASLPTIMNPSRSIAVGGFAGSPSVLNANLYFFSWIAFACILYIFGSYMQDVTGRDLAAEVSPKQAKWFGLLAASVIILSTSSKIHSDVPCKNYDNSFCRRNAYAVSVGVIGIVFPAGAIYLSNKEKMTNMIESGLATLMLAIFTAAVSVVTFGNGSGTRIGNLYFATWIGFIITVFLASECFHEVMEARRGGPTAGGANNSDAKPAPAPGIEEVEQALGSPGTEGVEVTADDV